MCHLPVCKVCNSCKLDTSEINALEVIMSILDDPDIMLNEPLSLVKFYLIG